MSVCAELTTLQRKENFDTNLHPDPEIAFGYVLCVVIRKEVLIMLF